MVKVIVHGIHPDTKEPLDGHKSLSMQRQMTYRRSIKRLDRLYEALRKALRSSTSKREDEIERTIKSQKEIETIQF